MADVNVNALAGQAPTMAAPMRTDDQILPHIRWVPIGKSNCYLDVEKPQSNAIYKIAGIVTRAHIDYAERIWEEFTQSIHTFIDNKRNLAQHTHRKKKGTLIVILSIRFTKLIIYHLQRKHKFHLRPDSSLHLPNKEPVLGYLKFSDKGKKREVFGMPIPGSLITTDLQGASYYQEYLAKVAKHERYLAGEIGSDPDSPTPKPTKTAKKPKPIAARQIQGPKPGLVSKKRKRLCSLRYVDESVAKDVPEKEPWVDYEEADMKVQEISTAPRGARKGQRKDSEEESEEDVPGADAGGQGEGQARPDPGTQDEGQARSNPDEQAEGQAGPDPGNAKSCGFTAMAYLKVQENLKLTVEEQVLLVEPTSSSRTLSSLQHLTKDLSFGDLFFSNKPSEADNDKATAKIEAELMVSVTIQQDMSSIPPMTTPTTDLTLRLESLKVHQLLKATATETTTTTTTTDAMMMKRIDELKHIMANLIQENKRLEQRDLLEADMKEILHQCIWETDSYKSHEDHMQLYEALEKSMNHDHSEELAKDLAEAHKKKKKSRELPKTPPGSSPHQPPPPPSPVDLQMDKDIALDEQAQSSDDEDIGNAYIPKTGDIAMFMDWFCKGRGITKLKPQDLEGLAFEIIKVFHPDVIHLQYQIEECHKYGSKGSRPALSISKMKATYYPDAGLEQMVPNQMWIEKECKYDIAAMYGISHWWFQRKRFYTDRHISKGDCRAVGTHMRILSVVRIKVFSMYGPVPVEPSRSLEAPTTQRKEDSYYCRQLMDQTFGYSTSSRRFQLGIKSYQTHLNLTKIRWDVTGFKFKHDYTVIDSLRVVTFQDRYGVQMRFTIDIEKVAVCSSLRSLKPKRTIESKAKRSSEIISLGHYSIMLASSHTMKSKTDIKSPTHYPCGIARTSE
uniref:E-beta-farnesene synthase n=1 Tax=Tanacetum cinerariifolium TaxID=118510 RepID=A0A6L2JPG3_TANCI|nr:E-beta-farnesene synthase [Tanacetum cinerariifolium]